MALLKPKTVVGCEGGSGGSSGGDGGCNCTTKDSERAEPAANEKPCPKPGADHFASFQPSPYESVMFRVHVAPTATANGELEAYGAPPISVVPSEHQSLQKTSLGYEPPEQMITEDTTGGDGGEGSSKCGEGGVDGGEGGGEGGEGGAAPQLTATCATAAPPL